jgi:CDGSH-type Zn-finger protein
MNSLIRNNICILKHLSSARLYCTAKIPRSAIENLTSAQNQIENGAVYDKKPFKLHLLEGKSYSWCLCGKSKTQPLCDGFHKNVHYKIKQRPVKFQVEKTGEIAVFTKDPLISYIFPFQEIITCATVRQRKTDLSATELTRH